MIERLARGLRAYVILAALTIVFAAPGLFSLPPLDRDESRFAQATAQMLETGDFVRIRLQDEPRNKKPVGVHWLQAASVAAFSSAEAREIWAYRLPSALGAALAVLAAFWGGAALIGRPAAFVGAALLGASLLLSTEAMIAKTDALLCGATSLAMAAAARLYARPDAPGPAPLLFWIGIALGVLLKGPIAPMTAFLGLATLTVWERRWRWLMPLARPGAVVVAVLIVAPWAIAIGMATEGAFYLDAFRQDMAPKVSGGGEHRFLPPGVHTALLPFLIFPASLGLAAAAGRGWGALRADRSDPSHAATRFLLAWAAPLWVVFELATTKLPHYPLPVYPALALLIGAASAHCLGRGRRSAAALFAVGGLGVAGLCVYAAGLGPFPVAVVALAAGAILTLGATGVLMARSPAGALAAALLATLALTIGLREILLPRADAVLPTRTAVAALRAEGLLPSSTPLLAVGYREPSLVFSVGTATRLLSGPAAAAEAAPGQTALVEARERAAFERGLATRGLAFAPYGGAASGHDYSNNQPMQLQPGRIVSADARDATFPARSRAP